MRKASVLWSSILAVALSAAVQAADSYSIDAAHTNVGFSVKHLVVSTTRGRFNDFSGKVLFDPADPSKSSVQVVIKVSSIDTASQKRDEHLKSPDFFDAAKFPEISFTSKKVEKKGDAYQLTGTLTMKGVSKEVSFPFTLSGPVADPWGGTRLGAEGSLTIKRKDFGVAWSSPADAGIGADVKIDLNVEAVKESK